MKNMSQGEPGFTNHGQLMASEMVLQHGGFGQNKPIGGGFKHFV